MFTFIVALSEAIMTNLLINGKYEIVTSYDNYFGEEMLVLREIVMWHDVTLVAIKFKLKCKYYFHRCDNGYGNYLYTR